MFPTRQAHGNTKNLVVNVTWSCPAPGRVKLNVDGSVLERTAGAGMILGDHEGSIIFSSGRHLHTYNDVLEAEIFAIMEGVSLVLQWCNLPIDIY